MSKNHFISIVLNESKSLERLLISNDFKTESYLKESEVTINFGDSFEINFLDNDVLQIVSKTTDIRIDIDISSIENSIKKFKDENNVTTK